MPKITWKNLNKTYETNSGTTILDAALDSQVPLEHACGGCCACTTCRVIVHKGAQNLSKPEEEELDLLERIQEYTPEIRKNIRLSCQSKVLGDIEIEMPE